MLSDDNRGIAVNEAQSYTCAMIFAALAEQRRLAGRVISDAVHEALDPEMAGLFLPLGDVSLRGRRQRANLFALRAGAMNAGEAAVAGGDD